jgi:hypothetical protein
MLKEKRRQVMFAKISYSPEFLSVEDILKPVIDGLNAQIYLFPIMVIKGEIDNSLVAINQQIKDFGLQMRRIGNKVLLEKL